MNTQHQTIDALRGLNSYSNLSSDTIVRIRMLCDRAEQTLSLGVNADDTIAEALMVRDSNAGAE